MQFLLFSKFRESARRQLTIYTSAYETMSADGHDAYETAVNGVASEEPSVQWAVATRRRLRDCESSGTDGK